VIILSAPFIAFRAWGREGLDGKGKGERGRWLPCRLISGQISKIKRVAFFPVIQTKEGVDHAFIHVLVVLIVVGVVLYLINTYIPMAGSIKAILNAVVVIVLVLWLLSVFGLIGELSSNRVGK
jgi:hypothetical protein